MTGKVSTQCSLSDALNGELTVEASAVPINSIDIHLLRVESILVGERIVTETSLIQTTQASFIGNLSVEYKSKRGFDQVFLPPFLFTR